MPSIGDMKQANFNYLIKRKGDIDKINWSYDARALRQMDAHIQVIYSTTLQPTLQPVTS